MRKNRTVARLLLVLILLLPVSTIAQVLSPTARLVLEPNTSLESWKFCAAQSLVAAHLVAGGSALYRLDLQRSQVQRIAALPNEAYHFAFAHDCRNLVTVEQLGKNKHRATLWNLRAAATPRQVAKLGIYDLPVSAMAFSERGTWLALATNKGDVNLWSIGAGAKLASRTMLASSDKKQPDSIMALAISGQQILVGAYRGSVHMLAFDKAGKIARDSELLGSFKEHRDSGSVDLNTGAVTMFGGGRIFGVALDGRRALALSEKCVLYGWPLDSSGTPGAIEHIQTEGSFCNALASAADGNTVAILGDDGAGTRRLPSEGLRGAAAAKSLADFYENNKLVPFKEADFTADGQILIHAAYTPHLIVYPAP